MEDQPLTNRGGDAREKRSFSGHNQMKDYIDTRRHDFKKLMTKKPHDAWGKRQGLAQ